MYATINVKSKTAYTYPFIPQIAIQQGKNGSFVYVENNGKASEAILKLGPTQGKNQIVYSGIKKNDNVIVQGFLNVKNGGKVKAIQVHVDKDGNFVTDKRDNTDNKSG